MAQRILQQRQIDATEGTLWKQLTVFSLPILLSQVFQQLYSIADTAIIGHFAQSTALAAVGISSLLLSIITNFFIGISTGISVVIARFCGAKAHKELKECTQTVLLISILAGFLFTLIGIVSADLFLRLLGTPTDIMESTRSYLRICFWGVGAQLIYNMGNAILRAIGNTVAPLIYLIVSSLVNLILDVVFIVVLHFDVQGAAAATIIAQWVSAILVLGKLMNGKFHFKALKIHWRYLKSVFSLGIPTGVQAIFMSISSLLIQTDINSFGSSAIAAMTVYAKLEGFLYFPMFSMGMAITAFVGQNMGANKLERAKECVTKGIKMCLFISIVFSLFLLCFTQQALSLFTKEQAVIGYASRAMIFTFPFYWAYAINQVYIGGLRGMGRVLPPMVITFLSYCLFRVVWCRCLLPLHSSMDVIFASYTASWFLMLICLKLYYHQELRRYDGTTTPILVKKNAA